MNTIIYWIEYIENGTVDNTTAPGALSHALHPTNEAIIDRVLFQFTT